MRRPGGSAAYPHGDDNRGKEKAVNSNIEYGVLAFATVLAGSVSIDAAMAKVAVIQAPSPALTRGSTFAWEPITPGNVADGQPALNNDIIEARLRSAIEAALIARGYRRATAPAEADLIISYRLSLEEQQELTLQQRGICGPRFGCAAGGYDLHQASFTQGKLILDLKEGRSGALVWRAISDKRVKAKDASQKKLDKALMTMTKSLPAA